MANERYSAEEVVNAVEAAGGVVQDAAARLGCSASTVYNYANRYVTVKRSIREARREVYAEAQEYLLRMMRDPSHKNHKWAVERVLRTYGEHVSDGLDWSDRERVEVDDNEGEDVTFNVRYEEMGDAKAP